MHRFAEPTTERASNSRADVLDRQGERVDESAQRLPPAVPRLETIRHAQAYLVGRGCKRMDAEDIVSAAVVSFLKLRNEIRRSEGLFITMVQRRAADACRRRRRELAALEDRPAPAASPKLERLERDLLLAAAARHFGGRAHPNPRRILRIIARLLDGERFPAACRLESIPRGSQGRYLRTIREWFESLPGGRRWPRA
jgi:hypothetical protein